MSKAKKKSSALARLVQSIEITNADGTTTMVPISADDNATANKILASQMRNLIQQSIEKFGNMDHMSPKELKDLTEAARNIAEFSGEVYKAGDSIEEPGEKRVDAVITDVPNFSALKANQTKPEKEPQAPSVPESPEKASA